MEIALRILDIILNLLILFLLLNSKITIEYKDNSDEPDENTEELTDSIKQSGK